MSGRSRGLPSKHVGKAAYASTGTTHKLPMWKLRHCPTCHAKPGYSCVRAVKGRIQEADTEGGVWYRPLKGPHDARRRSTVEGQ